MHIGRRPLLERVLSRAPFVILTVLAFVLPLLYAPWLRDPLNPIKTVVLMGGVGIALLLWAFRAISLREWEVRRTVLDVPLLLFLGLAIISTIGSVSLSVSLFGRAHDMVLSLSVLIPVALYAWLLIQETTTAARLHILVTVFLLSAVVVSVVFLFGDAPALRGLMQAAGVDAAALNLIARLNSVLGVFMSVVLALSLGMVVQRGRPFWAQLIPWVALLGSAACIVQIGFRSVWVLAAIAIASMLLLGWTFHKHSRAGAVAVIVLCLIIAILASLFGSPASLKKNLPSEVTLGAGPSWHIVADRVLSNPKDFLIGGGPGTFAYAFSAFRPTAFNALESAASIRFAQPFNTMYAIVSETGVLGSVSFLTVMLMMLGAIATSIQRMAHNRFDDVVSLLKRTVGHGHTETGTMLLDGLSIAVGWIVATVALFFFFFDVGLWWTWWFLLALTIGALHRSTSSLIHTKRGSLDFSPQQQLGVSFGLVVLLILFVIGCAYAVRFVIAEYWYTYAVHSTDSAVSEAATIRALQYRPEYADYHTALARIHLQEAKRVSEASAVNGTVVANRLAKAVNEAKVATDLEPRDVRTWDTLALMYSNARSFAPAANDWAKDALEQAIRLEPSNSALHFRLGMAREVAGELEEAADAYEEAIRLRPQYAAAYMQLASLREAQENIDAAMRVYERGLSQMHNHIELAYQLGRLYFNRGTEQDITRAEDLWRAILRLEPNHSNTLYSLGLLYEGQNKRAEALQFYTRVQKLNPENQDIQTKINQLKQ